MRGVGSLSILYEMIDRVGEALELKGLTFTGKASADNFPSNIGY